MRHSLETSLSTAILHSTPHPRRESCRTNPSMIHLPYSKNAYRNGSVTDRPVTERQGELRSEGDKETILVEPAPTIRLTGKGRWIRRLAFWRRRK
jgi:hypothetical protein